MARVTICLILTGFAMLATACTSSRNASGMPPLGSAGRSASRLAPDAERVNIVEFADLPKYGSGGSGKYYAGAIAAGADGLLWVIDGIDQDFGQDVVVGIDTSGAAKHTYHAASNYFGYQDIASGPDGALWLTDSYNRRISRLTTTGHFASFNVQTYEPWDIASGPDRALWFTAQTANGGAIGRITTGGKMTTYPLSSQPEDITAGPDGALWFTEAYPSAAIGRISVHGKITSFSSGISGSPGAIALGPDGALWFTESGPKIARITTSGSVREYSNGITGPYIDDIAAGPDGAMWFTETTFAYYYSPKIGRISMNGHITEYTKGLPTQAGPSGIAQGPDERMWFTDSFNDATGRITP